MHFEISSLRDIYLFLRRNSPKLNEEQLISMSIDIQRNQILMNNLEVKNTPYTAIAGNDLLERAITKSGD